MEFVEKLENQYRDRPIAVLIPKVVKQHWWQFLLHHYRVESLARSLLRKGDPRLIVTTIPWYLDPAHS
jgi:hypothetical protein